MTLIKELIEIPERVQRGDFVLKLAEGVTHAEATLRDYVVTPELRECFGNALSFIQSALQSRTSKATYLHGSFGAGKSHFMAVLHLILQGNAAARGIPELAPVIAKHHDWTTGKRFLLVPYHMIGAHDMESGILGGYVEFVRRHHPEASIPGVYLAEGLFRDARNLREQLGDEKFFVGLSEGADEESGWGDLADQWDAARFESAMLAAPGQEERGRLISALIKRYFSSYDTQAGGRGEAFVSLDQGLSVISQHAKALGYDALILFLDELVLWLASHAADVGFIHREGQKLAKLVEAQSAERPIPVISFVARQRDLRELIGDTVPGADRLNFSDSLGHWEGRFHRIWLEDRNLPAIAQRRVLKCKSSAARQELDGEFEKTAALRQGVMNTLLTKEGDREMFRKVYPFSPALVQTLIAVSSALQRERTALKVMVQLLVDHRETLKLGDIVPVGDLFDVVAHGDEAFSQELAIHFNNAKRLYHQKLLPLLERQHGPRDELEKLPFDAPARAAFRTDDRLIKTLLLAALVPEVETLRGLTAERLATLNHGSIKSPLPGREAQEVLRRCKAWAAAVGEIRIGEEANPTLSIQLSGVDTESIIEQARREDNHGNRVRRVRQILFRQLNIQGLDELEQYLDFTWRNTRRSAAVLFRNLRELPESSLENTDERWKLVIDYPFDEGGHNPRDDRGKLDVFRESHPEGARTLAWIPAFLSAEAQKDLGMLVILDHILTGERFNQYSTYLSPQDRQAARSLLENQRSVLTQRVEAHLDAAYGLDALQLGSLDPLHELDLQERFNSLYPGFEPRPPVAANLGQAALDLLGQALAYQFPAAPEFLAEVRLTPLNKVWSVILEAVQAEGGRVLVDRTLRPLLREYANPLQLGEMGADATHFVLGHHWRQHFNRKAAEALPAGQALQVKHLRKWIDEPRAMGLPAEAQNLVILTFVAQTDRACFRGGLPFQAALNILSDECELREQQLPDAEQWESAVERAEALFGVSISPLRNAANVAQLASDVQKIASESRVACDLYATRLRNLLDSWGGGISEAPRLLTAGAMLGVTDRLQSAKPEGIVAALARSEIPTTLEAMGVCRRDAARLAEQFEKANWGVFEVLRSLATPFDTEAESILEEVAAALRADELALPLGPALQVAHAQALRLITK
ncbi:MAG: phage resistance protein, partial [Actinomycetota bacterium]